MFIYLIINFILKVLNFGGVYKFFYIYVKIEVIIQHKEK